MAASERAFEHLRTRLRGASDRPMQDEILDLWLDFRDLATEWDAQQWGFNPDTWMLKERNEMYMAYLRAKRS